MTIPVPFPVQPGDRLRVTVDNASGTPLMIGDLVTVTEVGIHVTDGLPIPVVHVSTAYGPQLLTFDTCEPINLPTYTPAEPDDVVDAFFFKILTEALTEDDDLRGFFIDAKEKLAANDPKEGQEAQTGGGTAVAERPRARQVGESFVYEDPITGDELEVTYVEQDCPKHGREGGFYFTTNQEDEDAVLIPAEAVEPLIKYLFTRRNHSRRPEGEE